ncbi:MAG: beta-ribofuranosylaminobenzene 5'-phosphate synthase family protein [Candidatus Bathyarchaeia archaeon]|jgi:beta-RFAP synthase
MKVYVKTPARLHLGLIDLNGGLGRMFGGLGVGIDHPNVIVEAEQTENFTIIGQETELASVLARRFFSAYPIQAKVRINVKQAIPAHVGLGSGTQFSLAIAVALAKLFSVQASIQELTVAMDRAKRTGVGTAIFEKGGFVVDGGKAINNHDTLAKFPPLIFHQQFPTEWRFIVEIPNLIEGLSNSEETSAFNKLQKMRAEEVGKICRLTMLKLLPSLAEHDIKNFGEALTAIQEIIGGYFAQVQGGRSTRADIADYLEFMKGSGAYGVGQSSWGPAIYGVVKQEEAKQVLSKVKAYLNKNAGGQAFIAKANNKGATIKLVN